MTQHRRIPRTVKQLLATAAIGTLGLAAGPLGSAEGASSGSGPQASAAQTGCLLKKIYLKTIHTNPNTPPSAGPVDPGVNAFVTPRTGALARAAKVNRIMIFRVEISCTKGTSWKTTLQIRRRRTGPDKTVDYRQFTGSGSHIFIAGADCKKGQAFNGNFTINFLGAGQSADRTIKNKKCT